MSFEEEWTQLIANARDQQSTSMRLNQLPAPSGGGSSSPDAELRVSQKDLAAIGDEAFTLHQELEADGDHARLSSFKAASSLEKDFAIGKALDHVTTRWVDQQRSLLDACAHISNHLEYSRKAHRADDTYLGTAISKISALDEGFGERSHR